ETTAVAAECDRGREVQVLREDGHLVARRHDDVLAAVRIVERGVVGTDGIRDRGRRHSVRRDRGQREGRDKHQYPSDMEPHTIPILPPLRGNWAYFGCRHSFSDDSLRAAGGPRANEIHRDILAFPREGPILGRSAEAEFDVAPETTSSSASHPRTGPSRRGPKSAQGRTRPRGGRVR